VINLKPVYTGWFSRTGKWMNKQGAELANWEQNRVRLDYQNLDYFVDVKPWYHAKVLKNPDLELRHMRIWLPPPRKKTHRSMTTVAFMDCDGTPMYISREFKNQEYEIFNHLGQLVALAHQSEMMPGHLYFTDNKNVPFAIAASPTVGQVTTGQVEVIPQEHLYDFDHWQVWFMEGAESNTYLKEPDKRWVIAAIVQEHAILENFADNFADAIFVHVPTQYILCLAIIVMCTLGIALLCLYACRGIFFAVYPPPKKQQGNPFMIEEIGGSQYGSIRP